MAEKQITCGKFSNFLVNQTPVYDKLILEDIRPTDGWIGHVETGPFDAYSGTQHTIDRFRAVQPDVTRAFVDVDNTNCVGQPCDPDENEICYGNDRKTYGLKRQSWKTSLICFDQIMTVTKAREHFSQIISQVLKPATSAIASNYLRKTAAALAGKKWLATATMGDFTFTWTLTNGSEIFLNVFDAAGNPADPTSKLTPQMLQRRVWPQMALGALGRQPFKDMPPLLELVTDMETVWELDKATADSGALGAGYVPNSWRFQDWGDANKYYRYGFSGQLGNYAVRADAFPIRFNRLRIGVYQVVLPYVNSAATQGIGDTVNNDYVNALYQWSFIWHRRSMQFQTFEASPVNPQMPFAVRNFAGRWQWVMDNLGTDANGCVIENKRRNKGQFIADFEYATRPQWVEFCELIMHKREPACVVVVEPCASDPGYPEQYYDSACDPCPDTLVFTPTAEASDSHYHLNANTILCDGIPIVHSAVDGATIGDLITSLQTNVAILGTWAAVSGSTTEIQLTDSPCNAVTLPWVA